jgi:hypothetical protein
MEQRRLEAGHGVEHLEHGSGGSRLGTASNT